MPITTRSGTILKVKNKTDKIVDNCAKVCERKTRSKLKAINKNRNINNKPLKTGINMLETEEDTKSEKENGMLQSSDEDMNAANSKENDNEDMETICDPAKRSKLAEEETLEVESSTDKVQKPLDTNISANLNKSKSISLRGQREVATLKAEEDEEVITTGSNMPEKLLTVISNLYLNVGERLHLDFTPRCLDDLAYCHRHHYRSELPEIPTRNQAQCLRTSLEQCRYVTFINSATDMCMRGEFPGAGIFKKLIELVLSINYSEKQEQPENLISHQCLQKSIGLFSIVVRTFPPCWHKMRKYYVDFFDRGLDLNKLSLAKEQFPTKSSKIFDILLDLLEELFKTCYNQELTEDRSEGDFISPTKPNNISSANSADMSFSSEYWNQNQYEERQRQNQTFAALTPAQRLERIFIALRLLLQILEHDLAMWMLHHNKNTKVWIFTDSGPLIVVLCELTKFTRMTRVARRIFTAFSEGVAKGLDKTRLKVLERYIALLMMASNTIDMEHTPIGVEYPVLSSQTKTLIKDFFEIFKEHNREDISKYIENIELLRIPFVRYEFIDNVLFANAEPLTPEKVALDMANKRWQNYKPAAELDQPNNDISREQYLHLLLNALRSYCDWHGLKTFWLNVTSAEDVQPLTTTTDSVHRFPIQGSGVLVLKRMAKDIQMLESKLRITVRMSKPKVNLSLADICIDEKIIKKYRQDLKFVLNLNSLLLKHAQIYKDVDFQEWLTYLSDFTPQENAKETTTTTTATTTTTPIEPVLELNE